MPSFTPWLGGSKAQGMPTSTKGRGGARTKNRAKNRAKNRGRGRGS